VDAGAGTIFWQDPQSGTRFETKVTGGHCKLQWKADWAMRWAALGVDYEMSGKDLIDSVRLSSKICRILGAPPPESFTYELFLDEAGQKISKSKGNGLGVEEWQRYAPPESLGQFMFNQPQRAKRLYFDVIPKAVDEYLANAAKLHTQDAEAQKTNPAWHIHGGIVPQSASSPLSFAMLLNLASVVNAETPDMLWGFIRRYSPGASPVDMPFLARLVDCALAYYADFVRPMKSFREPDAVERAALHDLATSLASVPPGSSAEDIQTLLYDIGKRHAFPELRAWFSCLYQVLLGQMEGPRFGQFVALYGVSETVALIDAALARTLETA
jgi:lysyl-tRNA synthetase class 1